MRQVIVSNVVSLDGFIESSQCEIDWFKVNDEFMAYAVNMLNAADTILFGRKTYQMMAAYWPLEENIKGDPLVANKMNTLEKIVFSKTLDNVEWNNSRLIKDNIITQVQKLKQQPGKDILILGSGTIVSALMQAGLIDECRLIVIPVILGAGNAMFRDVRERIYLDLEKTKTFSNGTILLYYKPNNKI